MKRKLCGAILALLCLAVGCMAGCGRTLTMPELSDEQILSSIDDQSVVDNFSFASSWSSGEEAALVSKDIIEVVDSKSDNTLRKTAYIDLVYGTSQVRETSEYLCEFMLRDGEWVQVDLYPLEESMSCVGGISDDLLVEHAAALMQLVDEEGAAPKGADDLSDLYSENFSAEVIENCTEDGSGTATVGIAAMRGLTAYRGTLMATFEWSDGDWIVSCVAEDSSYEPDYSGYEGTWAGSFTETKGWGTWNEDGSCYAAKENLPTITIKDVDSVSCTAKADLSFVIHAHKDNLENDVNGTDGDTMISLSDMLITLEPDSWDSYKIIDKQEGEYEYLVFLENDDSGNLSMKVETFKTFQTKVFDFYDLSKSS